ncbi:RhoGAP domain containing protein [Entamoeba marina]
MSTSKTTRISSKFRRLSFREKKDHQNSHVVSVLSVGNSSDDPNKTNAIVSPRFTSVSGNDSVQSPKQQSMRTSQLGQDNFLNIETVDKTNPNLQENRHAQTAPITPSRTPSLITTNTNKRDLSYKNRRMSWISKNASEQKRDISMIAMDDTTNVLSERELKLLDKEEVKRQKLLKTSNPLKKCEIIFDIQCLLTHHVVTLKKSLKKTVLESAMKYFKKNTKEIVQVDHLLFRTSTGKILSKNMTLRGVLALNSPCVFICYADRPFSLPKMYPSVITNTTKRVAIPQVVFNMCWWIYTYGNLIEGIFRVSGNSEIVKKYVGKCVEGDTSFLSVMQRRVNDVHNVVGILKMYLREKTDGLISYDLVQNASEQQSKRHSFVVNVLTQTPIENRTSFIIIYGLIQRLVKYDAIHRMTMKNFAMILGPLVIHSEPGTNAINATCNQLDFSNYVVNNYDGIVGLLGYSNPFSELPYRDDIKKFSEGDINKSLNIIKSMDLETPAECERLRKMMDDPDVVNYIKECDQEILVEVISVIIECLSF